MCCKWALGTYIHLHLLHQSRSPPLMLCLLGLLHLQLLLQLFNFVICRSQVSPGLVQLLLQGCDVTLQGCSLVLCCRLMLPQLCL